MATFTWTSDQGISGKTKPKLMKSEFGDGYVQSVTDGINNKPKTWSLRFSLLNLATYQAILAFLDTHGGATAFDWTPPNGTAGRYVCEEWDEGVPDVTYAISATFQQVYGK